MDKLKGYKEGDRVRVTFEGVLISKGGFVAARFIPAGSHVGSSFIAEEINHPAFTIEKLQEPLKAGDRVKWVTKPTLNSRTGEIITIYCDTAWVKDDQFEIPKSLPITSLTKIS